MLLLILLRLSPPALWTPSALPPLTAPPQPLPAHPTLALLPTRRSPCCRHSLVHGVETGASGLCLVARSAEHARALRKQKVRGALRRTGARLPELPVAFRLPTPTARSLTGSRSLLHRLVQITQRYYGLTLTRPHPPSGRIVAGLERDPSRRGRKTLAEAPSSAVRRFGRRCPLFSPPCAAQAALAAPRVEFHLASTPLLSSPPPGTPPPTAKASRSGGPPPATAYRVLSSCDLQASLVEFSTTGEAHPYVAPRWAG